MSTYNPDQVLLAPEIRKAQKEWIENYSSIKKLAYSIVGRRRRGSPATVNAYIIGVKRLVEFTKKRNPDNLLEDIQQNKIDPVKILDEPRTGFIDTLLETKANKTVHRELYGIKKWLEVNDIQVDWNKIETPTTNVRFEYDRAPTKQELRMMLDNCMQIKDRMALLVLSSSGLRIGTFLTLTWGDVSFNYPDVARITVKRAIGRKFSKGNGRGDSSNVFITWITPEARNMLEKYRDQRISNGEVLSLNTPLFGNDLNPDEPMKISGFHRRYYLILKRASLDFKERRNYTLHVHTLRKYFRTMCVGVDEVYREHWMGHKGGYLDESYFRAEEARHLDEYRKAIHHISVYETTDLTKLQEEYVEVKAEVVYLKTLLMDALNNPDALIEARRRLTKN
jgi:integrase